MLLSLLRAFKVQCHVRSRCYVWIGVFCYWWLPRDICRVNIVQEEFKDSCHASFQTVVAEVLGNKSRNKDASLGQRLYRASVADLFKVFNTLARIAEVRGNTT